MVFGVETGREPKNLKSLKTELFRFFKMGWDSPGLMTNGKKIVGLLTYLVLFINADASCRDQTRAIDTMVKDGGFTLGGGSEE